MTFTFTPPPVGTVRGMPEPLRGVDIAVETPSQRILCFDFEARPLGWYGGDWVHKEITVVASAWVDDPEGSMESAAITTDIRTSARLLKGFLKRYNEADIVMGHYIRGFDLTLFNGAMLEFDLGPLPDKLTIDTKGDLLKISGLSKSMENLGGLLGLSHPKVNMNAGSWRLANRLTPDGIALAKHRCEGDVLENIEMYEELKRRGFLSAPKLWTGGDGVTAPGYHA